MKIGSVGNTSSIIANAPKMEQSVNTQNVSTGTISKGSQGSTSEYSEPRIAAVEAGVQKNNDDVLDQSVKQANQTLKAYDRKIDRTVHEVTKAVIYTVRDTKTNEVISEFPSKKIQDMIAKMWELAGLVVDDKA